ncbi:low temperature requirement protein A [Herbiconiux ginsengi]|uniref:Low temperature requirement protein LtrA n=1 Tax=Herbiconiux ginsengi TaxID=381665 RepID=A0A1H3KM13_9MICO|nr:low temperature requirement protein A [Herbiconiux ginsengi]SDY53090.1 Low temperature requirement protein LtrA [Herbiconiux ginsengi]
MSHDDAQLRSELKNDLRHRLRPLTNIVPRGRGRQVTPLELLYDLVYVIAFGAAAEEVAASIADGHVAAGIGAYLFAIFAVGWSWLNFTWYASAYGNDDAIFRVATIVQMVGALVLVFGLPQSFHDAAEGQNPNNLFIAIGYLVMRVPLILLWLRAARQDEEHRRSARAYAVTVSLAQLGWLLTAIIPMPAIVAVVALAVLVGIEMVVRVLIEQRLGRTPWEPGHIAERFGLLTLIALGEVVAATTRTVVVLTEEQGWSVGAVMIAASGLVLAAGIWWAYYLVPSAVMLRRRPERVFAWRYTHLLVWAAIPAVGAGLRLAAEALEGGELTLLGITVALVVPVGAVIVLVFLLWSILMRSYDLTHIPLLAATLVPLVAAIVVAVIAGTDEPFDAHDTVDLAALVAVIALVALSAVVEVVGHEIVGYSHTVRALERNAPRPGGQNVSPSRPGTPMP